MSYIFNRMDIMDLEPAKECAFDWIQIFDGGHRNTTPLLERVCGRLENNADLRLDIQLNKNPFAMLFCQYFFKKTLYCFL